MSQKNLPRRDFIKSTGLAAISLAVPVLPMSKPKEMLVYVGTYTNKGKSEGIYVCKLNLASGELKQFSTIKSTDPAFLAIDRKRKFLYAANEIGSFEGKPTGTISAFSINQSTGELTFLNQQISNGAGPCNVTVDKSGKNVLVANYSAGSVSVIAIKPDGSLGEVTDTAQHQGSSVNLHRQKEPHAHCIIVDESNRFAFSADLGTDKVMIYKLDAKKGKITPNSQAFASVKPGSGPRHFAIHPKANFAFVINELASSLTSFAFDKVAGTLKEVQTVPTIPSDFNGTSYCADVHIHPSGKFIYGSNRGHDSIVSFEINPNSGNLSYIEHQSVQGKWPRNFAIDPTGQFLLVANQNTDNIVIFRIDEKTGKLTPTGNSLKIPAPVCLKLIPSFS